jgi:hypothetical protein
MSETGELGKWLMEGFTKEERHQIFNLKKTAQAIGAVPTESLRYVKKIAEEPEAHHEAINSHDAPSQEIDATNELAVEMLEKPHEGVHTPAEELLFTPEKLFESVWDKYDLFIRTKGEGALFSIDGATVQYLDYTGGSSLSETQRRGTLGLISIRYYNASWAIALPDFHASFSNNVSLFYGNWSLKVWLTTASGNARKRFDHPCLIGLIEGTENNWEVLAKGEMNRE